MGSRIRTDSTEAVTNGGRSGHTLWIEMEEDLLENFARHVCQANRLSLRTLGLTSATNLFYVNILGKASGDDFHVVYETDDPRVVRLGFGKRCVSVHNHTHSSINKLGQLEDRDSKAKNSGRGLLWLRMRRRLRWEGCGWGRGETARRSEEANDSLIGEHGASLSAPRTRLPRDFPLLPCMFTFWDADARIPLATHHSTPFAHILTHRHCMRFTGGAKRSSTNLRQSGGAEIAVSISNGGAFHTEITITPCRHQEGDLNGENEGQGRTQKKPERRCVVGWTSKHTKGNMVVSIGHKRR